jgi:hypothetical protein
MPSSTDTPRNLVILCDGKGQDPSDPVSNMMGIFVRLEATGGRDLKLTGVNRDGLRYAHLSPDGAYGLPVMSWKRWSRRAFASSRARLGGRDHH